MDNPGQWKIRCGSVVVIAIANAHTPDDATNVVAYTIRGMFEQYDIFNLTLYLLLLLDS